MSNVASFVQFPHPGGEPRPRGDHMSWSTGNHGRKFLRTPGRYVADDEQRHEGEVVFWGEWEAPSRVECNWPVEGDLPRWLHRPYWSRPRSSQPRQNTDSWVFGDRMRYSNCKQIKAGRPTAMQRLLPGSVICFGSTLHGEFCVDTVFVVATAQPWTPDQTTDLDLDDAFLVCTADPLAAWAKTNPGGIRPATGCAPGSGLKFTLYRGATHDNQVHGMYSLVPARPANHPHPRFARPVVHLPDFINPASTQSPRNAGRLQPIETVRQAWTSLHDQVLAYDLVLATSLTTPPCASTPEPSLTRPAPTAEAVPRRDRSVSLSPLQVTAAEDRQ